MTDDMIRALAKEQALTAERDLLMVERDAAIEQCHLDAHAAKELKAERDAALARERVLRDALERAKEQFASYAAQHWEKATPDGDRKALVNERMVVMIIAALASEAPT